MKRKTTEIKNHESKVIGTLAAHGFRPRNTDQAWVMTEALNQLREDDFTDELYRSVFRFISEYHKKEGVFPSSMTIKESVKQDAVRGGYDIPSGMFGGNREENWNCREFADSVYVLKVLAGVRTIKENGGPAVKAVKAGMRPCRMR